MSDDEAHAGGDEDRADSPPHVPVMPEEVVAALAPRAGEIYVDGTFGAGGHARAILAAADCRVAAFDRDPSAVAAARDPDGRLILRHGRFSDMERLAGEEGVESVDGVVLDLGVSSMQLDEASRGFSFVRDGPLDMRMDSCGPSAEDFVNGAAPDLLKAVVATYGEEPRAGAITRAVVAKRAIRRLTRTGELAAVVAEACGFRRGRGARHPATNTFRALRMHLNDELGELARGLPAAERLLKPGGRLVVLAFHSLEDRIVKTFFAVRSGRGVGPSRHVPEVVAPPPSFTNVSLRARRAGAAETAANPRARSALLRFGERTKAPPSASDACPYVRITQAAPPRRKVRT